MISNLQELEKLLGQYEDWTEETLLQIVQDEKLLEMFTPELAAHLFETRSNDTLFDILLPVKYGHQLKEVQKQIDGYLERLVHEEITLEEVKEKIILMKDEGVLFSKISAYLTILAIMKDVDVKEDKEIISSLLEELIEICESIDLDNGMQVIIDILEIVIPVRELYFERYEIDLLDDTKPLSQLLEKINQRTEELVNSIMEQQNIDKEKEDPTE
jgi:hypothetical protein